MEHNQDEFFSIVVEPINNLEAAIKLGCYDSIYDYISTATVPLQKASGSKRVYFIPVNEDVEERNRIKFLTRLNKKPIVHAPNYLLGAMAKLRERDLPENLKLSDIVALSEENTDIFIDSSPVRNTHNKNCFLVCERRYNERQLNLITSSGTWYAPRKWCFIAEDITCLKM